VLSDLLSLSFHLAAASLAVMTWCLSAIQSALGSLLFTR
jgi:hypothetical protein